MSDPITDLGAVQESGFCPECGSRNCIKHSGVETEGLKTKIEIFDGEEVVCEVVDFSKEFPPSSFEKADKFKKVVVVDARQATEREFVVTRQDNTEKYAEPGDWIIHNPGDLDPYVYGDNERIVKDEAGEEIKVPVTVQERQAGFAKKYVPEPGQPGKFRAKGEIKAYKVDRNIVFMTTWGKEMSVKAGGWVADGGYCISAESFDNTYEKIEDEEK